MTGAPGSGKSAIAEHLANRRTPFTFLDVDWLAEAASALAARSIWRDGSTWPAYRRLWLDVLWTISRNGGTPVLFAPWDRSDLAESAPIDWADNVEWCLLDCSDEVRTERLQGRGWSSAMIDEALKDAATLRQEIDHRIDSGNLDPQKVADQIVEWLKRNCE